MIGSKVRVPKRRSPAYLLTIIERPTSRYSSLSHGGSRVALRADEDVRSQNGMAGLVPVQDLGHELFVVEIHA